jgi:hypothetical protein
VRPVLLLRLLLRLVQRVVLLVRLVLRQLLYLQVMYHLHLHLLAPVLLRLLHLQHSQATPLKQGKELRI